MPFQKDKIVLKCMVLSARKRKKERKDTRKYFLSANMVKDLYSKYKGQRSWSTSCRLILIKTKVVIFLLVVHSKIMCTFANYSSGDSIERNNKTFIVVIYAWKTLCFTKAIFFYIYIHDDNIRWNPFRLSVQYSRKINQKKLLCRYSAIIGKRHIFNYLFLKSNVHSIERHCWSTSKSVDKNQILKRTIRFVSKSVLFECD
jgi:hypothetical protein